jgi:hypothetical protein
MVRDKTLDRALDRLRRPGATLTLTYTRDTVSGRSFHIQPDARVQPCDDGLFPGCAQSWRLGDWRKWTR